MAELRDEWLDDGDDEDLRLPLHEERLFMARCHLARRRACGFEPDFALVAERWQLSLAEVEALSAARRVDG